MSRNVCSSRLLLAGMVLCFGLLVGGCTEEGPAAGGQDPVAPWTDNAIADAWLTSTPFADKHDGGWVYSAREDRIYAMYGNDNNGQTLYRINHIDNTFTVATGWQFGRHGSHPVIDDAGTYIYMPPSQETVQLERYNTVTGVRETLAPAPDDGTFSHGAWKNNKLWIVLDDGMLYSYNPADNTWSASLHDFGDLANVAASGPASNLIYILVEGGDLFSYDVVTTTLTDLNNHPYGFTLGGNSQFTWFGAGTGFLYAVDGAYGTAPAIFDIAAGAWQALSDPKTCNGWYGHATYDSTRMRLYIIGTSNAVWYYQY